MRCDPAATELVSILILNSLETDFVYLKKLYYHEKN